MIKCWACIAELDPPMSYAVAYIAGAVEARCDETEQRDSLCAEHRSVFDEFMRLEAQEKS